MKLGKARWLFEQINYGKDQGMKTAMIAFAVFLSFLITLVVVDPLGFVQQGWHPNLIHLHWQYMAGYIAAATAVYFGVLLALGWGYYPKKAEKDLARNLIILGEEQVFPNFEESCDCEDKH